MTISVRPPRARGAPARARGARYAGVALRSSAVRCLRPRARPRRRPTHRSRAPLHRRLRESGRVPMFTSATCVAPFVRDRDRADDRPVLGAPVELLVREAVRAGLGHADLDEQSRRARARSRGNRRRSRPRRSSASPAGPCTTNVGVEREQHGGQVGRRVAVRDGSAERAPVPHLVVADLRGDRREHAALPGEHVARLEIAVPGERADRDRVAVVAHVREVAAPGRRRRAPSASPAAASSAGSATCRRRGTWRRRRARPSARRFLGRPGPHVVERRGDHRFASCDRRPHTLR